VAGGNENSRREQRPVVLRDGTEHIATNKEHHHRNEQRPPRYACREQCQQRARDGDGYGVAGDEQSRRRDVDAEIGRHGWQQSGDDELAADHCKDGEQQRENRYDPATSRDAFHARRPQSGAAPYRLAPGLPNTSLNLQQCPQRRTTWRYLSATLLR
jgi:hypothetical protein